MKNLMIVFFLTLSIQAIASIASFEVQAAKSSRFDKLSFVLKSDTLLQNTVKDTSITVYGNCSSCKKAIEKAAKSVKGVKTASWDKKKKILNIQYDISETSLNTIEKAIIDIGYDTENMRAEESVYNELHECCKYDRKPQ
jgi:mercuric ion binding protein